MASHAERVAAQQNRPVVRVHPSTTAVVKKSPAVQDTNSQRRARVPIDGSECAPPERRCRLQVERPCPTRRTTSEPRPPSAQCWADLESPQGCIPGIRKTAGFALGKRRCPGQVSSPFAHHFVSAGGATIAFLLLHDADRLHVLFRKTHGLPTGRFDLVSLPGFTNVVFRLDLVSGLLQVRGGDFGNEHFSGPFVLKYNSWSTTGERRALGLDYSSGASPTRSSSFRAWRQPPPVR